MVTKIVGVVCLLIAVFQFYNTHKLFIDNKKMVMVTHHISY